MRQILLAVIGLFVLIGLPVLLAVLTVADKKLGLQFELVEYTDLPGWGDGSYGLAQKALLKSCDKMQSLPQGRRLPGAVIGGRYRDWFDPCKAISNAAPEHLPSVLEKHFSPLAVTVSGNGTGMFTGYYEALLQGSLTPDDRFSVPLYARPPELVTVDLGQFRPALAGKRVAGTVKNGRLVPYADRKGLMEGALKGRDLEVLWVDSAVDAYFLHVQGSGRVMMPDGNLLGVGYASQNGHANRLIGRHLIAIGAIEQENMSGQAIRKWMAENPDKIESVLKTDPSFVFFRKLDSGDGPYGSANVSLTPGHSLAVDRRYMPLHAPVWLSASHPDPADPTNNTVPFNRLVVAQDTGGAISGEIRGDVFWGFGAEAEEIAGRMANEGRYWLLLPKELALRAAGE